MLIVETGAIIANANSYVTLSEVRAYALSRGVILSSDDAILESQVLVATDYLEAQRANYKGSKVAPSIQSLQWPREEAYIEDTEEPFSSVAIPRELHYAQCQLVIEVHNNITILPTRSGAFVTHEKVGAIETNYSEKIATTVLPIMAAVDNWLEPLFKSNSLITTVRV
jgi:hypothetical protein